MRSLDELQRLVSTDIEAKDLATRYPELVHDVHEALRGLQAAERSLRALGKYIAPELSFQPQTRNRDARMGLHESGSFEMGVLQLSSPKTMSGGSWDFSGEPPGDGWGSDNDQGISGWEGTVRKGPRGTILPTDLASLPIAPAPLQAEGEEDDFDAEDWGLEEGFTDAVVEKDEAQVHMLPGLTAAEEHALQIAADQHRHMQYWERKSPALDPNLIRRMGIVLVAANAKRIAKQQKEARRQAGIVFEEKDLVRSPRRRSPVKRMAAKSGAGAISNEDDYADGIADDDLELSLANFGKARSASSTESGSEDWDAAFDDDEDLTFAEGSATLSLPEGDDGGFDADFPMD